MRRCRRPGRGPAHPQARSMGPGRPRPAGRWQHAARPPSSWSDHPSDPANGPPPADTLRFRWVPDTVCSFMPHPWRCSRPHASAASFRWHGTARRYFTAPRDRPRTSCRCAAQPMMITGSMAMVPAAASFAQNRPFRGHEADHVHRHGGAPSGHQRDRQEELVPGEDRDDEHRRDEAGQIIGKATENSS